MTIADVNPGELYRSKEVADLLKVTIKCLEHWRNNGTLTAVRIGHTVRYLGDDLLCLVGRRRVQSNFESPARRKKRAAKAEREFDAIK